MAAIMNWLDQHNIDAGIECGMEDGDMLAMAAQAEPLLDKAVAESLRDTGDGDDVVEDGMILYDHDAGRFRRGLFVANKDTVSFRLLAFGQNQTLII